jgi:hypothetical protein
VKKIILFALLLLILLWGYWWIMDKQDKSISKIQDKNISTIENHMEEESKELHYQDVIKEPKPLQSTMGRIIEIEEIKKIDQESRELMDEADRLIEEKHLDVDIQEDQKVIENHQKNLDQLANKLDGLK